MLDERKLLLQMLGNAAKPPRSRDQIRTEFDKWGAKIDEYVGKSPDFYDLEAKSAKQENEFKKLWAIGGSLE